MFEKQSFKKANAQVVKSVKQRQLLDYWLRSAKLALPKWASVDLSEFPSQRDDLIIYAVLRQGPGLRYKIVRHGPAIVQMYGSNDVGKALNDALPANVAAPILAVYDHCVRARKPVYTVTPLTDADNRPVAYERLILPFRVDGNEVEVILGSIEVVSIEGRFDMARLMSARAGLPANAVQSIIEVTGGGQA